MHEDPPMVPVDDELPMQPYNVELRAYQDDIGRSLNYHHMTVAHMMHHMNIPRMNDVPDYPYIRSWEERWNSRKVGPVVVEVDLEEEKMGTTSDYPLCFNLCLKFETIFFYLFVFLLVLVC